MANLDKSTISRLTPKEKARIVPNLLKGKFSHIEAQSYGLSPEDEQALIEEAQSSWGIAIPAH